MDFYTKLSDPPTRRCWRTSVLLGLLFGLIGWTSVVQAQCPTTSTYSLNGTNWAPPDQGDMGTPACGSWTTTTCAGGAYKRFNAANGGSYSVSTCATASGDWMLTVREQANLANLRGYNDDNGPQCTGLRASLDMTSNFTGVARVYVNIYGIYFVSNCGWNSGGLSAQLQVRQNNNIDITGTSTGAICTGSTKTLVTNIGGGTWSITSGGGSIAGSTYTGGAVGAVVVRYTIGACYRETAFNVTTAITRGNITGGTAFICPGGDPAQMQSNVSGGAASPIIDWYYRDGAACPSGGGNLYTGFTGANYDPPAGLAVTRSYQYYCSGGGCNDGWAPNCITTQVYSTTNNPGTISAPTTICLNGSGSITNVTAASTGAPASSGPNYYYYWQRTTAPVVGWTMYSGPTAATSMALPAAVTNTAGTYIVTRNSEFGCAGQVSANMPTVTVLPAFSAGSITGSNATLCNGGDPAAMSVSPTGGVSYSYQWYYVDGVACPSGGGAIAIAGATGSSYDPPAGLTVTRSYQCQIDATGSPDCGVATWTSNCITATVLPTFSAGAISGGGGTICNGGDPGNMTVAPSGGAGSYSYQWYYRDGAAAPSGSPTIIAGATSASYDPPAGLTVTRSYQCQVDATGSPDCGAATWSSNFITVTVNAAYSVGAITGTSATYCNGGNPSAMTVAPTGGSGSYSYQWYYVNSGACPSAGGQIIIAGATSNSYDPPAGLTNTRTYQCLIDDIGSPDCGAATWTSNCITATVLPAFSAGTLNAGGETICNGGNPGVIGFSAAPSGANGTFTYQWYYLDGVACPSSGTPTMIAGATSPSYDPPAGLTVTRSYQCQVTATGSPACGVAFTSNCWTVTVLATFSAGNITGGSTPICYNTSAGMLTANPTGGVSYTYQWYYQDGATQPAIGSPTLIAGATGATYTPPAITATRSYQVQIDATGTPDCGAASWSTNWFTATVLPNYAVNNITGGGGTICNGGDPTSMTVSATGGSGSYSYQWYYLDGSSAPSGGAPTLIPGATAASYDPPAGLTVTRSYQVQVDATGAPDCGAATWSPNFITVTVLPAFSPGSISGGGGTICSGGDPGAMTVAPTGSTSYSYQWYYLDGAAAPSGGGATMIAGATSISYDPPAGLTVQRSYQVQVTGTGSPACGGTQWSSNFVTVSITPQPTANAGGNISGCTGAAAIPMTGALVSGAASGGSWSGGAGLGSWSQNLGNPATATFTPSVPNGSFTATLTAIGSGVCTGFDVTATRTVTWSTTPNGVGSITPPATGVLCNGAGVYTLTASGISNATANAWVWSLPAGAVVVGANNTASINVDFSAVTTGVKTITATPNNTDQAGQPCPGSPINLVISVVAPAASMTWIGGFNGNEWNEPQNWGLCAPGCNTNVIIDDCSIDGIPVISAGMGIAKSRSLTITGTDPNAGITMNAGSILEVCGNISLGAPSQPLNFAPGSTLRFVGTGAQAMNNGNFTIGNNGELANVEILGAATHTVTFNSPNIVITGNLTIGNGANVITATRNAALAPIKLGGNLNVTANAVFGFSKMEFTGPLNASISGPGAPIPFTNIIVNKSAAANVVTLNNPVTVSGNLSLTSGILRSQGANMVQVTNTNFFSGLTAPMTAASYIWGGIKFKPNGMTGNFLFPTGSNNSFNPIGINWTSPTNHTDVTVEYITGNPGMTLSAPTTTVSETCMDYSKPKGYEAFYTHGQWDVSGTGGASAGTYDMTLFLDPSVVTPCANCAYTVLTRPDANPATPWTVNGTCDPDFGASPYQIRRKGMTTFSGKTAGKTKDGTPFPVELMSFTATPNENSISLDWITASELNNQGFDVERSLDGTKFTKIDFVAGKGSTTTATTYNVEDKNVELNTEYYYRLRQIDLNGNYKYSNTVQAMIMNNGSMFVQLYPNPTSGDLNVKVAGEAGKTYTVRIYSTTGQLLRETTHTTGSVTETIDLSGLAAGTYQVQVKSGGSTFSQKVVKL